VTLEVALDALSKGHVRVHDDQYWALRIRKEDLILGAYYFGSCRNAQVARWNGVKFLYWRYFGHRVPSNLRVASCPHFDDASLQEDFFDPIAIIPCSEGLREVPLS